MIVYDFQCDQGHRFEGWFEDRRSCEEQEAAGLISCPICSGDRVTRLLSPVAVRTATPPDRPADGPAPSPEALGRAVSRYLETHFDDVGCDFAREALKIHYGAAEPRNIRGVSSEVEEQTLKDEGIQFFKIPVPVSEPEDD